MPRHLLFLIYNDTDNTAPDGKIKLVVDDTNIEQEAQLSLTNRAMLELSLTNRAMLVCKVLEV